MVFAPLGGVGEIGMNMGLYGFGPEGNRKWLIVDCGVTFAGPNLPGIDLILPDIRFLEEIGGDVVGMVLTHAHEDHYGAVLDIWPDIECELFASSFAKAMIDAKASSNGYPYTVPATIVEAGKPFKAGPFTVELVSMAHSIPESFGLIIESPAGTAFHTGDWKLDPDLIGGAPTDIARLRELGKSGKSLALVCDSTNATRDGESPSEAAVAATLERIIAGAENRVAVTIFASNVGRMVSIARAAQKAGRQVVAAGRAVHRIGGIARDLGLLEGIDDFLDQDAFGYLPRDKTVLICTGSQGEARAAMARIARGEHPDISLAKGDMVIFSSRAIPGNEREVIDIHNMLVDQGVELITDRDALVHVSGHPRRDELRQLYDWLKPETLVPVHGEPTHLHAHAKLGRDAGIKNILEARNGDMVTLFPTPGVSKAEVPTGRVYLDGNLICDPEETRVGERRKLSFAGHITASLCINGKGQVVSGPDLRMLGVPELDDDEDNLTEVAVDAISGVIKSMPPKHRGDPARFAEALRRAVRGEINAVWGKKPVVDIFVHKV
ncbi:ribonuclease J [Cucumibacter marinus]|uniref:ribonuclease J n=1 Tax=Cucumibacter marinus TaxID=1121252 RepID=UPI0005642690|nr:ribonuclease J [Cucumibacter marinus]